MVLHERFPTHKHGRQKRGQEFENFSKKAVLLVLSGKKQISPLLAPCKNFRKNPLVPSCKNSFQRSCTQACKITPFMYKIAVLHHLATLFSNTNVASKPQQGDRFCTAYSDKQLRNPAKLQIIYYS